MKKITVKTIKSQLKKIGVKPTKKNINYYAKELYKLKKGGKLKGYNFSKSIIKLSTPKNKVKLPQVKNTITRDFIEKKLLSKKYKNRYGDDDYLKMYNSFDSYMKYYMTGKERKTINKLLKGLSPTEKGKLIVGLLDKTGLSFSELMYGKNGGKLERNSINQFARLLSELTKDRKLKKELKSIEGIEGGNDYEEE